MGSARSYRRGPRGASRRALSACSGGGTRPVDMATKSRPRTLTLPSGWGVTQLLLHFEGEDLSRDTDPFAANVLIQLRMDAEAGEPPQAVLARDREVLAGALAGYAAVGEGEIAVGGARLPYLETRFSDEDGRTLQQLVLYLRKERYLYTVAGTHVAGPRFEAIRPMVLDAAASFFAS